MDESTIRAKPLDERMDVTMKRVEELMNNTRLNNNFINDVAVIYERRGYKAADIYVRGKFTERLWDDDRRGFNRLLEILSCIHDNNLPAPIASFILKKLNGIRLSKEGDYARASQKPGRQTI
jgi:hypothetical protein